MPISVQRSSKRDGNRWIFRDVDLECQDGEIFGVFGRNSAGKNTLLQVMAGKTEANGGTISGTTEALYFDASSEAPTTRFGGLFGKKHTSRSKKEGVEKAIEKASRTLMLNEPFSGLDVNAKSELVEKLRSAASERSLCIVIATASFDDVLSVCDRAAVIVDGYVRQTGTPQELYDEPEIRAVASLTGLNNLFEARRLTSSKSDLPEFQTIEGSHRLFTQKCDIRALGPINKNVTLAIRPEQLSISFGASFPEDNLVKAVITGTRFMGSTTIIELDCSGLKLEALVFRVVGLNVGDECMVGLPPDRIRILSD